jgi:hypothetical protein
MTLAAMTQPATSTEHPAKKKDISTMRTQVATARTGQVCAEKVNLLVYTGKAIGWVAGFLHSATSRSSVVTIPAHRSSDAAKQIAVLWEAVDDMQGLPGDWNGYNSEPPNEFARQVAKQILLSATNVLVPTRVAPSAQGGIGICFYGRNNKYADIECLNTGEILATLSDGRGRPEVWDVRPIDSRGALERIGKYIAS